MKPFENRESVVGNRRRIRRVLENMKRLLCIVSAMNTGGAETFLMKIYRKLDRTNYQMDFCVQIPEEGFYDREIKSFGGRIFRITAKSVDIKRYRRELYDLIKRERFEYVMRIASNDFGFLDLKIAKEAGVRVCIARSSNSSDGGTLKTRLAHLYGKLFFRKSIDVKIAPSDLAAIYSFGKKEYKKGNVTILHNGIDFAEYEYSDEKRRIIRDEFGTGDRFLVGHIGRLTQQKNHKFLLDIFRDFNLKNPSSLLMLVGRGELEDSVRRQIDELRLAGKVIFAGVRSDVGSLLSAFDCMVFPSFYEGMPNTIIEAQASGLNCLISSSITKDVKITPLVEFASLEESSSAWARRIKRSENRNDVSIKRAFYEHKYDIEACAENFVNAIFDK